MAVSLIYLSPGHMGCVQESQLYIQTNYLLFFFLASRQCLSLHVPDLPTKVARIIAGAA